MSTSALATVCPVCGQSLRRCRCRLSAEQSATLSAAYKRLLRLGGNGRVPHDSGGGICFDGDEEDAHTNGETRGIVSAPKWIVDGAAKLIGGPFDLDVAALATNAKASRFFTPPGVSGGNGEDGLKQRWMGERIWCNVPYRRDYLVKWVRKAYQTAKNRRAAVVCLLPYWPGTDWFQYLLRGQLVLLYGGHGLPTGRFAENYFLLVFDFIKPRTWSFGMMSHDDGFRFVPN